MKNLFLLLGVYFFCYSSLLASVNNNLCVVQNKRGNLSQLLYKFASLHKELNPFMLCFLSKKSILEVNDSSKINNFKELFTLALSRTIYKNIYQLELKNNCVKTHDNLVKKFQYKDRNYILNMLINNKFKIPGSKKYKATVGIIVSYSLDVELSQGPKKDLQRLYWIDNSLSRHSSTLVLFSQLLFFTQKQEVEIKKYDVDIDSLFKNYSINKEYIDIIYAAIQ